MSDQGETFAAFIEAELKSERDRRVSLDNRGLMVITTSGSLTTLLAAVGAFVSERSDFQLPGGTVFPLAVTLFSFAVAGAFGLLASVNRQYDVAHGGTLDAMLTEHWATHEVDARNAVARLNALTVTSLREGNNGKATLLMAGLALQLLGLASLAVAVFLVMRSAG